MWLLAPRPGLGTEQVVQRLPYRLQEAIKDPRDHGRPFARKKNVATYLESVFMDFGCKACLGQR